MKKAKSTTLDERLKIVMECLANDKNYGAMALKKADGTDGKTALKNFFKYHGGLNTVTA